MRHHAEVTNGDSGPAGRRAIGLDIGGTNIRGAVVQDDGTLLVEMSELAGIVEWPRGLIR